MSADALRLAREALTGAIRCIELEHGEGSATKQRIALAAIEAAPPAAMVWTDAQIDELARKHRMDTTFYENDPMSCWRGFARQMLAAALPVEEAPAELESLRKDAERYRWLRVWLEQQGLLRAMFCRPGANAATGDWWVLHPVHMVKGSDCAGYGKYEDAAIDAAMAAAPQEQR